MRPIRALSFALALASGVGLAGAPATAQESPDLFVVVTSPDNQTQGMAMVLTTQAVQRGASAHVLLCGPAGDLALQESAPPALKPRDVTPKQMLEGLIAKGVPVEVCALYLPNGGHQAGDLIEGVGAAMPPAISEMMLAEGVRYFTF